MTFIPSKPEDYYTIMIGKRKLEKYEQLARYQKKRDLQELCDAMGIDYDPKATRMQLALLITKQ